MNKARVAEAVRGTYPKWNRYSRKEYHVDPATLRWHRRLQPSGWGDAGVARNAKPVCRGEIVFVSKQHTEAG